MTKPDSLTKESTDRERMLFKCRMAENAERFDDMVKFIKEVCESANEPLGPNERNYLSVAYKNCVSVRRSALRCLTAMRHKYSGRGAEENVKVIDLYYEEVLKELQSFCQQVLDLIEHKILKPEILEKLKNDQQSKEFKVFFYKMNADYYRYLCEFAKDSEREEYVKKASENYKLAKDEAYSPDEPLAPSHPIRLGLCLNYSVFLYEIAGEAEQAKELAKTAFDKALDELNTNGQLEFKDSTLILQLLRDNTTLWNSHEGNEEQSKPTVPS